MDNFFLGKSRNIEQSLMENDNIKLVYQDVAHYEKMKNLIDGSPSRFCGRHKESRICDLLPVFDEEGLVAWVKLWFQDVEI